MLLALSDPDALAGVPAAHLATPVAVALGLAGALAIVAALRLLGRSLIRIGSRMESRRHGPLPGGYMDPSKRRRAEPADASPPPEPERYDPFNAG